MAKADGTTIKEFSKIKRQDLPILDDLGIQPFDQPDELLLDIVEDKHGKVHYYHCTVLLKSSMILSLNKR